MGMLDEARVALERAQAAREAQQRGEQQAIAARQFVYDAITRYSIEFVQALNSIGITRSSEFDTEGRIVWPVWIDYADRLQNAEIIVFTNGAWRFGKRAILGRWTEDSSPNPVDIQARHFIEEPAVHVSDKSIRDSFVRAIERIARQ